MAGRRTEPLGSNLGTTGTEEIREWIDRVHRLPEIRVGKVVATRRALQECRLDGDKVLDVTISRICEDLGASLTHD